MYSERTRKIIKNIFVIILILVCFSCTKEERSTAIKEELSKNDSQIVETIKNEEINPKYIINRRSGKVHSYTHGMNCGMSEHNKLESNENIEEILKNENYDICLTCFAGLKLNLDKYKTNKIANDDDVDLTNKEVNLIKLYMNMYEFGQLDTETQKFLICIFEVGSWYVHNVYTQLGGQNDVVKTELIARASASNAAYNKWRNYLDNEYYSKYKLRNEKKILPTLYDYDRKKYSSMVAYRCDLFKDAGYGKGNTDDTKIHMQTLKNPEGEEIFQEYKNYCVIDDSSKFAAAVYYHYINKEILKDEKLVNRIAYGIDLWETKTIDYSSEKSTMVNKLVKIVRKFKFYNRDRIKVENDKYRKNEVEEEFNLKAGDLIYKPKAKKADGNVEFYIGNGKVIGWGHINKTYVTKKNFKQVNNEFYSDYIDDKGVPYIAILRLKGGR